MRKIFNTILALAAGVSLFVSCQDKVEDLNFATVLRADKDAVELNAAGDKVQLQLTANGDWIAVAPDWLRVEPGSGSGNALLTVSAPENENEFKEMMGPRNQKLFIYGEGVKLEIPIKQAGLDALDATRIYKKISSANEFEPEKTYLLVFSIDDTGALYTANAWPGKPGDGRYQYWCQKPPQVEVVDEAITRPNASESVKFIPVEGGYAIQEPGGGYLYQSKGYGTSFYAAANAAEGDVWTMDFNEAGQVILTNVTEAHSNGILQYLKGKYQEFACYTDYPAQDCHTIVLYKDEAAATDEILKVEDLQVDAMATQASIPVTANKEWVVRNHDKWIESFAKNEAGDAIDVTFGINTNTKESRTATFIVIGETTNKEITLTQKPAITVITAEDKTVSVGRKVKIGAKVNSEGDFSYVSADPAIATVSEEGEITGVAIGETTVTISVTADEIFEEASKDIKVTVVEASAIPTDVAGILEMITSTSSGSPSAYEAELTGAVVTCISGKYIHLEDESAAVVCYMDNPGLAVGDVLSGKVVGKGYIYKGLPELTTIGTEYTKTPGGTLPATEITIAQLAADYSANMSRRIVLRGVKVTDAIAGTDKSGKITQGSSEMALYAQNANCNIAADQEGDLVAYPSIYNSNQQLAIYSSDQFTPAGEVETTLTAKDVTVQVGKTVDADVQTNSPGALSYESDNEQIATVDAQGVITGVAEGEANVTVTVAASGDYEEKSATFKVTVTAPVVELPTTVAGIVAQITSSDKNKPSDYEADLTGAVVSYVNGGNAFIEDESGAILLFMNNHGLTAGDVISGKVSGTGYKYYALPEITSIGTEYTKTAGGTIPEKVMTIADLLADYDANISRRIVLKGVTVTDGIDGPNSDRGGTVEQNGSSIALRDQLKKAVIAKDAVGDLVAFPILYNTTRQLAIYASDQFIEGGGGQTPETTLTAEAVTVQVGQTVNASVQTNSPGALSYESENVQIATVDNQGVITGVAEGETNITVTVAASGDYAAKSATFKVTVTAAPSTLPSTVAGIVAQITSTTAAAYEADLTGAVVSYVNGKNVYLEDASGAVLAFLSDANHGLVAGDVISGKVSGTAKLYSGLPEVLALGDEFTKTSGGTIPLTEMTIADLNANFKANISRRVIIKGVTVETGINGPGNARNGKISQNGSEIVLRDENKAAVVAQGSQGDVIGFPLPYNTTNQFGIWESSHFTAAGGQTPETTLTAKDVTVQVGKTVNAEVTTNSPGALSYESENVQIATVDNQGVITGMAAGQTNITVTVAATSEFAEKSVSFKVTVTEPAQPGGNDGSLEKPYTASEAAALAASGDTGTYYIYGKVTKVQYQFNTGGTASVWLDENGQSESLFEGYKLKYIGNVNWVTGNALLSVGDELIINGQLKDYVNGGNHTLETNGGYIVSWNGKTQALSVPKVTATPNNANKQITVEWTAATGTNSAVSYVVKCGTQSYNATAAGSHVFTMDAYGTYEVSVAASADDAIGSSATASATLSDSTPPSGDNIYAKYSGDITEGDYIIYYDGRAMKNTVTNNRFDYADVTPSADTVSDPDASIVWHISASGDYWIIYNASVSQYAGSTGSKNQGKLYGDATSDNVLWTVTGNGTYEFENKARAAASSNSSNKWLRNNGTYGFACYANSTGGALTLFKKDTTK